MLNVKQHMKKHLMRADTTDNFNFYLKLSFNINLRCYKYIFIQSLRCFAEISNQERWYFFPATKHSKSLTRNRDIGKSEVSAACCPLVTKPSDSFVTPWTEAHQTPLSMGFSSQEYWSGSHFLLQGILQLRDQTLVSCIGRQVFFTIETPGKPIYDIELHKIQTKQRSMK